ncbi:hypothetical protein AJ88_12980 [Mesorhizobium amorphae CCBAU 01583]|nr:hypothetical protein AJ88_12980 [Mesorhizobium amorphae CCBAU 01583]
MSALSFSPKVPVKTNAGHRLLISNVQAASKELLTWTERGPHWNRAARVCTAALTGNATPQEARRCFRIAAIENGASFPALKRKTEHLCRLCHLRRSLSGTMVGYDVGSADEQLRGKGRAT